MTVDHDAVAESVRSRGYCLVAGHDLPLSEPDMVARDDLSAAWFELPPDPYVQGNYRFRRHAALHFLAKPATWRLDHRQHYFQRAEVNRLTGGMKRQFAPIPIRYLQNRLLRAVLNLDVGLAQRLFGESFPAWEVHVHFVRVAAKPAEEGLPSPEGRHRDGFDFIALHHIQQRAVLGGVTSLHDGAGRLLQKHRLVNPLDSLFADDARVTHDVSPVYAQGEAEAYRDMLLTSYSACDLRCGVAGDVDV